MLSHLRTEAYPVYARHHYPPAGEGYGLSYERNVALIDRAKQQLDSALVDHEVVRGV
jgi:hypothetical protein